MKAISKRIITIIILMAMLVPSIAFGADDETTFPKTGKVGVLLGGILDVFCEDALPGGKPEYFKAAADMPLALEAGKIDCYIDDELSAISHCRTYSNIRIDKVVYSDHYGFIFNKDNAELCNQMSEYIRTLRANGKLDELKAIWVDGDDESKKVVEYDDLSDENGTIRIAIAATMPPMIYVKDGKYAGYELEVLVGFCREYGYGIEFSSIDFSGVMASVTTGVADIGAASISITDERKESMLFSESHIEANSVTVVRKSDSIGTEFVPEDFANSRIGVLEGTNHVKTAEKYYPDAYLYYFNSYTDIADALDKNRIDAYIMDEQSARSIIGERSNQIILTTLESSSYAYAMPKGDAGTAALKEELDNYINKIRESGELREIESIWFGSDKSEKTVDLDRLKDSSKILTVGVFGSETDSFVSVNNGQYGGFEIDILARFCDAYGYGLDIKEYSFDNLLMAAESGECNIAAGAIVITDERSGIYEFSVPSFYGGNVLVINNINGQIIKTDFWTTIKNSFYKTFIKEKRWKLFVNGSITSAIVSVMSVALGTLIAFWLHLIYWKKNRIFNNTIDGIFSAIEKIPSVLILMILYYIIFGRSNFNAAIVAIIGLSIKFAVGIFTLLKTGIGAVSNEQTEAALALSYTKTGAFVKIVFPQALMHIIPSYKGRVVNLIEQSSIIGYIAVQDLTKVSDIIRSRTYEAFFPLIVSAIIYILIAVCLIFAVSQIEKRLDPKRRSEEDILRGIKR